MSKTDVHTEHCCKHCGCKYALELDQCTVVSGRGKQRVPCGHTSICWDLPSIEERFGRIEDNVDRIIQMIDSTLEFPIRAKRIPREFSIDIDKESDLLTKKNMLLQIKKLMKS